MTTIGVLGVGTLGSIFAARLIATGESVIVFDQDERRLTRLHELGAAVANDVAALSASETVLVSLPDPPATQAALLAPAGLINNCPPGALVVDTSTIDPSTARQVGRACSARGIDYVEAPLSGGDEEGSGVDAARAAATTFMCGASAAAMERARPLLHALGRHVLHVGPVGDGATAKLVSNHMAGLHNLVAAEALAVGRAAGLTLQTMIDVLRHTDGKSYWLLHYLLPRLERADFDDGFAIDLQHKDHRLFGDLAAQVGAAAPMNDVALARYDAMRSAGLGRKDVTEAANAACRAAGIATYDELVSERDPQRRTTG